MRARRAEAERSGRVQWLEGRVDQLAGGGVDVVGDPEQAALIPLGPGAAVEAVGGAVAVGDEAVAGELAGAGELGVLGRLRALKGSRSS